MAWSGRSAASAAGCLWRGRPTEVTILDVVNAVDPIQRIKTCPLGLKTHGVRLCPLHRRMDDGPRGGRSRVRRHDSRRSARRADRKPAAVRGRRAARVKSQRSASRRAFLRPRSGGYPVPHPPEAVPLRLPISLCCVWHCFHRSRASPTPSSSRTRPRRLDRQHAHRARAALRLLGSGAHRAVSRASRSATSAGAATPSSARPAGRSTSTSRTSASSGWSS